MQFLCIFNWKNDPAKSAPLKVQLFLQTVDVGAHPKNKAVIDRYKRVVFVNYVKNNIF